MAARKKPSKRAASSKRQNRGASRGGTKAERATPRGASGGKRSAPRGRPRAKRPARAARTLPVDPPSVSDQLRALFDRLRKRHKNLVGIGVGYRRSGANAEIAESREMTIRLLVTSKPKKKGSVPSGERPFKDFYPIIAKALGHSVRVQVPVDIEQLPETQSLSVRVYNRPVVRATTATAYAAWTLGGERVPGIITCGHDMPPVDGIAEYDADQQTTRAARVAVLVDPFSDRGDVSLLRINTPQPGLLDIGPTCAGTVVPTPDELIGKLGMGVDDNLELPAYLWSSATIPRFRAVAYFVTCVFDGIVLDDLVECDAPSGTFQPGLSGSLVAADVNSCPWLAGLLSRATLGGERAWAFAMRPALDRLARAGAQDLAFCFTAQELYDWFR